jgi:uncharacterized protein YdaU (DUF1376 family)
MHLTLLEHGIYRQLLDWYYLDETPLPSNNPEVIRRLLARTQEEQETAIRILQEFFKHTENGWIHARCDKEIAAFKAKADRARDNGKRGGRPNKPTITKEVISGLILETQKKANSVTHKLINSTIPPTPKGVKEVKVDEGFEAFWESYPRKTGKGAARNAWAKAKLPEIDLILSALHKAKKSPDWLKERGAYIPHPATWLNQCRWEDSGMDYDALTQKRVLSLSSPPQEAFQVDEQDALNWIAENYEVKAGVPYRDWPQNVQAEYRNQLKRMEVAA